MNDIILLKQGEMVLKGLNRREFENRLIANIKRRLKPFGEFKVYAMQSTVYVEPVSGSGTSGGCGSGISPGAAAAVTQEDSCDLDGAYYTMKHIFGALSVTRAAACEKDKDAIVRTAAEYLGDELQRAKSFKVESKRSDKSFPMTSVELSQYVGGELHEQFNHITPDMHNPEFTVNIEIRDLAAYVHGPAEKGAGGLPVGTGGSMVALLSGGIDSPVALYMMARRGVRIIPIHFHSPPYTSLQAKEKVLTLAEILEKYCGSMKVELVNFTRIQEEISTKCPAPLATVLARRFMVRIAERIAIYHGCSAIVTGDNLGQVASQTVDALAVTDEAVKLPIFRPLLAFDKGEITDLARKIGTFDTSVLPYEDCCTVFTPKRPKTKPRLADVLEAEEKLDIENLMSF